MGLYFQAQGSNPASIGKGKCVSLCSGWIINPRAADLLGDGGHVGQWEAPTEPRFWVVGQEIMRHMAFFEAAILWWALRDDHSGGDNVARTLRKAGWVRSFDMPYTVEWKTVDAILVMAEGEEKEKKLAQAREESPLLLQYCLEDIWCGR